MVFATKRICGRTDYRVERKIKKKKRSIAESKDVFNSERVLAGIWQAFVSGKPAPYWHKHGIDWVLTLQLAKKNYRAKLSHAANAESDNRTKKGYELTRGRRARIEGAGNVEGLWKAVFLMLKWTSVSQLLRQKKREIETKGMRRPFLMISRP